MTTTPVLDFKWFLKRKLMLLATVNDEAGLQSEKKMILGVEI